jgi:predicted AlkP superfamily pyrophosphatase or phosphodiesterase
VNLSRSISAFALLALAGCAGAQARASAQAKPALLVLISVDQLRGDLLQRYDPYFVSGFRRLIDQGAYFNATHHHAASETGPGHATLSTGVTPARSGITANDWSERVGEEWVTVYNVQDTLSPILGYLGEQGRSPRNLLRTGMADWTRAADPSAKVVSIAGKDRSAILMAAKAPGQVYWYNTSLGRFVTSRHYRSEYPEWVERFNRDVIPTLLDSTWVEESPVAARRLAGADTAKYEADSVHTYFPHSFADDRAAFNGSFLAWAAATPYPDRATAGLAREAIAAEGLGKDDVTDYLAVGFSMTDAVGHRFGPTSREQLDNLIRLDRLLGDFFTYLDETVGRGRWVVALSADHGANTNPEWNVAQGRPGHRITAAERQQMTDAIAAAVRNTAPGQTRAAVAAALRRLPFIADVYTNEEIASGAPRDSFVTLFRNSYRPERPHSSFGRDYGLEIRAREGTYLGAVTGSGHGGPYFEDRYVPLIFLGGGIQPMKATTLAHTVDLAATMARIGRLPAPDDLDGKPLPVSGAR